MGVASALTLLGAVLRPLHVLADPGTNQAHSSYTFVEGGQAVVLQCPADAHRACRHHDA